MGMYDYVHVRIPCPNCGTNVSGFQSKDANCNLSVVSPENVNRFYSDCCNCGKWVEFERRTVDVPLTLRDEPYNRVEVEAMGFKLLETSGIGYDNEE